MYGLWKDGDVSKIGNSATCMPYHVLLYGCDKNSYTVLQVITEVSSHISLSFYVNTP